MAWRLLPPRNRDKEPENHEKTLLETLDAFGIILFAAFMGSAVLVLDLGGQKIPWDHPFILFATTFGCISAIVLFIHEPNRKGDKLLPPELLLSPGLSSVFVGQSLFVCALVCVSIRSTSPAQKLSRWVNMRSYFKDTFQPRALFYVD